MLGVLVWDIEWETNVGVSWAVVGKWGWGRKAKEIRPDADKQKAGLSYLFCQVVCGEAGWWGQWGVCPVCPSRCTNNESERLLEIHSAPGMVHGGLRAFPPLNPQTSPTREVLLAFPFPGENLGLKRLNSIKEVGGARLDPCPPTMHLHHCIDLP